MMLMMVEILLLCLFGFFISYLFLLAVLALSVPERISFQTARKRRFACVIPAHNEELSIEKTIISLRNTDYPTTLFDVVVIADNCTDDTKKIAMNNGAVVIERYDKQKKGKGYALQWGFDHLLKISGQYEGFIVIDADSIASKNIFTVMNWYLEEGHGSIQAADLVAQRPGAWSSEVSRIALTLYNYVRPLGRKALNCSSGLRGNGMCFSDLTLRKTPWNAHSLTEDLEYGVLLMHNGINTVFAPEAKVTATMPVNSQNAESQRERWEAGRLPVVKKYIPILFRSFVHRMSWHKIDAMIELLTPAFVNMFTVVSCIWFVKIVAANIFFVQSEISAVWWFTLILISVAYVIIGLIAAKADSLLWKALLYLPLYVVWKLQLYFKLLMKSNTKEWIRTTREQ